MIELIFVIVIIGILAAVAIPKLAATRTDAQVAGAVTSGVQALQNLGAEYTSQGAFTNYTGGLATAAAPCYTFATTTDGNVSVTIASAGACATTSVKTIVGTKSAANGLTGTAGAKKIHQFGGIGIKE